jgi:cellulose synthase/poly-beta-1,6-N-acetylglucosamine synthase-like glycosyltransferase
MSPLEMVFCGLLATIAYTYFCFPLLIALRSKLFPNPVRTGDVRSGQMMPSVSLILVAHNEEDSIGSKIENILALDYPANKLQVIVVSDGSTDRTDEIVRGYLDRRIEFLAIPRLGKAHGLNTAVERADGEILVFSDANSIYAPDAIRQLVAPFADDAVGGVAGDQRYRPAAAGGESDGGERAYWNFDRLLKRWESQAGHVISATGAIYAIRRQLFQPVPDGVTDDFVTSTRVILQGQRLVFAERAVAYEPTASSSGIEFGRKVRVMTRGLRGVLTVRRLLNPFQFGFYSIQLFTHKVLRRLMVVPLIMLLVCNGLLITHAVGYLVLFGFQCAFYLAAVCGIVARSREIGRWKVLKLPAYFCMVNAAAMVALANTLRGHRIDRWKPQRTVDRAATA